MKKDYSNLKETVGPDVFAKWQEVDAEVYAFTDLGIKVAINDEYSGLVYKNEVYAEYRKGQKLKAFIKCVREDGKIDVSLQPDKGRHVFSTTDKILEQLEKAGGKLRFNDASSPEDIKNKFQISKTVFKQAIGRLYKQRRIKITDKGIELVK
ncbi:MAG: type I-B CRISPR-associated protein Cas8b1/Cst1 [Candidatus Omnitrophica bacterium]|nr:type I-B CRISPR-associated protein Cas8b1/Cst1 [Candidatus Omnitrophota bacterium]